MRPPLILLLEDNEDEAVLLRHALAAARSGCTLEVLQEGQAFLDTLGALEPAVPVLLILDLKLRGMDGLEVLRRIRAHPVTRTLPALVLTSSEQASEVRRAYELGANAYLHKPVLLDDFVSLLKHLAAFWFSPSLLHPPR